MTYLNSFLKKIENSYFEGKVKQELFKILEPVSELDKYLEIDRDKIREKAQDLQKDFGTLVDYLVKCRDNNPTIVQKKIIFGLIFPVLYEAKELHENIYQMPRKDYLDYLLNEISDKTEKHEAKELIELINAVYNTEKKAETIKSKPRAILENKLLL